MDLATWAAFAEILGGATVVGGVAFAVFQVRQFRRQRRDATAMALIQSFRTPEGERAMQTMIDLSPEVDAEAINRDPSLRAAAQKWCMECEALGFMVYQRVVPLHFADDMFGGVLRDSWRKLRPWVEDLRARTGVRNHWEWFQWLVERIEERPSAGKAEGAHVAHRVWRP